MTEVSVVISLFGAHRGREILSAVVDAWLGQDIRCEVVIGTDADGSLGSVITNSGPDRISVVTAAVAPAAKARLSNIAADHARGDWLYLTDADVVPLGRDYLRRALTSAGSARRFLTQPRMLRLTGPSPSGSPSQWEPPAGQDAMCFVRRGADGALVRHPGESVFVWTDLDGQLWVDPPPDLVTSRPDEFLRRPALHWGSVLVARKTFEGVGGYSEQYSGWGCEDEDLLDKLRVRAAMLKAWQEFPELLCVHFEHPWAGDTPEYAANRLILKQRRRAGAEAMIEEDLARRSAAGP